jgi:hypothetical protein
MARKVGGEAAIRARMARAPGLTAAAAHRLAGLLEAESYLALTPNNRDGWRCACAVALREDDMGILREFHHSLGIGRLNAIPARNTSRPQVSWIVDSKAECAALVDLLDRHPLRGRKLSQYWLWRDAVRLWGARRYGLPPGARVQLGALAAKLTKVRAYRTPDAHAGLPHMDDCFAPFYFAGFFSGEGCFRLGPRDARLVIKVRRDDRPLLEAFRRAFGIGSVRDVAAPEPWSPAVVWQVVAGADVLEGIRLLESGGLLGRKRRQFEAWRPGAEAVAQAKIAGRRLDGRVVAASQSALAAASAYRAPAEPLETDRGYAQARIAFLDVLRAWAASTEGPLSCTRYQAARELHPFWPKRETIAFAFGGWYEALRCAGLEDRAARRPRSAGLPSAAYPRASPRPLSHQ